MDHQVAVPSPAHIRRPRAVFTHKSQAGYTLLLVLVVLALAFMLSGVVMRASMVQHAGVVHLHKNRMSHLAALSGLERTKANLRENEEEGAMWTTNGYQEDLSKHSSFVLNVNPWGGYVKAVSIGRHLSAIETLSCVLGQVPSLAPNCAIALTDAPYGIVVAGDNSIRGDVAMAGKEVKPSTRPRMRFTGQSAIEGKVISLDTAGTRLSNLTPLLQYISFGDSMLRVPVGIDSLVPHSLDIASPEHVPAAKTIYIEGTLDISLPGVQEHLRDKRIWVERNLILRGTASVRHVDFIVGRRLVLRDTAKAEGCLVYARRGAVLAGGEFRSQVVTSDSIKVLSDCVQYPAFLFFHRQGKKGGITFAPNVRAECVAVASLKPNLPSSQRGGMPVDISLSKGAIVNGVMHATGLVSHSGTIHGMVTAKGFHLYKRPTTYINWLFSSNTDRSMLRPNTLLPMIFGEDPLVEAVFMHKTRGS